MSNRVWIASELFYPDETSTGHYLTHIAVGLAKEYDVRVISTAPPSNLPALVDEDYRGIKIHRIKVPNLDKNRLVYRLIKLAWVTLGFAWFLLWKIRRGDRVLVVTNPPTLPYIVLLIARLKRAKGILRVDDVYPDAMIAAGLIRKDSKGVSRILRLSSWLYNQAESIVVLGRDMAEIIRSRTRDPGKIMIIPNWADLEMIEPRAKTENPMLAQLGVLDKFIVLVAGNIGRVQGVDTVIEAAVILKNRGDIHFVFVGAGALERWVREKIISEGLANVSLVPNQPRSEQIVFLNACDVALLSLKPEMCGVGVPSRLYNYMAAGKPLIGVVDRESEPGRVIVEEKLGWVSPPGDARSLAIVVIKALESSSKAEMGVQSYLVAKRDYDEGRIIKMYGQLLKDL